MNFNTIIVYYENNRDTALGATTASAANPVGLIKLSDVYITQSAPRKVEVIGDDVKLPCGHVIYSTVFIRRHEFKFIDINSFNNNTDIMNY